MTIPRLFALFAFLVGAHLLVPIIADRMLVEEEESYTFLGVEPDVETRYMLASQNEQK